MPEGNEVHRFAERQSAIFTGKKVNIDSPNGRFLAGAEMLDGRKLRSIEAYGKHLGYDFGSDRMLHIHLGRYGDFWEGKMPYPEPKGALRMRLWTKTDWLELRGASDCSVYTQEKWGKLLARLGPDPLRDDDPEPAIEAIRQRKTAVGALLMEQSILAGIGNIYRAELLYRAKINPFRPGAEVGITDLKSIWREAKKLMREGMVDRRIVTTRPKDRPHKKGTALREETHYVYRRAGKPCFVCGEKVLKQEMAGRTLYWCGTCQRT